RGNAQGANYCQLIEPSNHYRCVISHPFRSSSVLHVLNADTELCQRF
ncbi:hypothetical protein VCHENC02_1873B, partial [Vibrio harveyi]